MPYFPIGYLPPPVGLSASAAAPNPAETAWTLGDSAAGWDGRLVAGFDLVLAAVAKAGGSPIAYADDDTLDAKVWRGQAGPVVMTPALAWAESSEGSYTLTIPAASSATAEPGTYRLQVGVTAAGIRSLLFDGSIVVAETSGSTTFRAPYVARRDLLDFYGQLETIQSARGDDATFLRHRVKASDQFDRELIVRYDPRPGMVKVRRSSPHPLLGWDVPDPSAVAPTPAALSAKVAAGGVIVDENVREMVSKMTLVRILEQQEVMTGNRNTYRDEAAAFRDEVKQLWLKYDIQVDTSSPLNGVADLLVGRDVILLPSGTAP